MEYVTYKHWEDYMPVFVRKDLKGKHREHCLCFSWEHFHPNPEGRKENCLIANAVYDNCVKFGITTPVWECPIFKERTPDGP